MKENTFKEQLNDILDSWFDDQDEETRTFALQGLNVEEKKFSGLEWEEKYKLFELKPFGLMSKTKCLISIFTKAADSRVNFSFTEKFIADMVDHVENYDSPLGFFNDLTHGCQSGMIGMLVYNSDCKSIYIQHIDDMEQFKEEMEYELGEAVRDRNRLPHYTFLCWLCYEELGFSIARTLFPDEF
jgi:hypothetical protein